MIDIISALTGGEDPQERNILLRTRLELTNYDCYERAAKYFSKNCFSIAKVSRITILEYAFSTIQNSSPFKDEYLSHIVNF